MWIRTCQECGHKQSMKSPTDQQSDNWRDAICRKCRSPALDYGSEVCPEIRSMDSNDRLN
jgi:hypothetical protein